MDLIRNLLMPLHRAMWGRNNCQINAENGRNGASKNFRYEHNTFVRLHIFHVKMMKSRWYWMYAYEYYVVCYIFHLKFILTSPWIVVLTQKWISETKLHLCQNWISMSVNNFWFNLTRQQKRDKEIISVGRLQHWIKFR